MLHAKLAVVTAILALAALPGRSWAVTNAVVGKCKAGTQFTTIQAAVNAATAGSTVQVCPGSYPEQVTILKNLTLKGLVAGLGSGAIIVPPAGGLKANSASGIWGSLAAQLLVQQAATVTVTDMEVDGGGGTTCPGNTFQVGILFQGPGGLVTNSAVRNMQRCQLAIALFADVSTNLKFTNNSLSDCGGFCMEVDYDYMFTGTGNMITSVANTVAGIDVRFLGGPATFTNNIVAGNVTYDAEVSNSAGVTMTGNTFLGGTASNVGIFLDTVSQSTVQSNKISGGLEAFIIADSPTVGGNTITKNTVSNEYCGMSILKTTADTLAPNTYLTTRFVSCP
jgi:parallel beta-helix repeat protein